MRRSRRPPAKKADSDSDDGDLSKSVVFLSSSDDEEANKDWSRDIVARATERELKRKREEGRDVIAISTSSSDDFEMNFGRTVGGGKTKKTPKGKNKMKKKKEVEVTAEAEEPANAIKEEDPVDTADSVITEVNEVPNNAVLRKLLRGPRYFDPVERDSGACFNCGEEGHAAMNCPMEKRKKPCFICGELGHFAKQCSQGQDCYVCRRRGHVAKNCPDKNKRTLDDSIVCLRCGDIGHDMFSCGNDYAPEDLKEIQCYVCKDYGHLCCVNFVHEIAGEVSCYNCAETGHTGIGCAKHRGELIDTATPTLCFRCGEEGHFARGCTKNSKTGSAPRRAARANKDHLGFLSVPRDFEKAQKLKKKKKSHEDISFSEDRWSKRSGRKNAQHEDISFSEDRWSKRSSKSRPRGGWMVDDPGDASPRNHNANKWRSPSSTSSRSSHKVYSSPYKNYSESHSPFKKHRSSVRTPTYASTSSHHRGYSTPRHYGRSQDYF